MISQKIVPFLFISILIKSIYSQWNIDWSEALDATCKSHGYISSSDCQYQNQKSKKGEGNEEKSENLLKILTLNAWGRKTTLGKKSGNARLMDDHQWTVQKMNSSFGFHHTNKRNRNIFTNYFNDERLSFIANVISEGNFDIVLLQEVWIKKDHKIIMSKIPKGYSFTKFSQLNQCGGNYNGRDCSGLAIVSKYPFLKVEFQKFNDLGCKSAELYDGEHLAGKGVGMVRISPDDETNIDVFVTHTAADQECNLVTCLWYTKCPDYDNSYYRQRQVEQMMNLVTKSNADIKIVAGDLNTRPKESPYEIVEKHMKNSFEEIYSENNEWMQSKFATYGNAKNTWTGYEKRQILDYIFYQNFGNNNVNASVESADLTFFKVKVYERYVSVSDHEGVKATIRYGKCNKDQTNYSDE